MIEYLENIDTQITLLLNGLHNPFMDFLMYHITHLYISIPIYILVILLYVLLLKRQSWRVILFAIIAVFITSLIVNNVTKPIVARLRPCNTEALQGLIYSVNGYVAKAFSFPSSHSATGFAIAVFAALALKNKYVSFFLLLWACLYAYSRIYLGVHFFGDVVCGAIIGSLCAWAMYKTMIISEKIKN